VSIKPINPVKPSNKITPVPEFLFFSIAQKKPKAIAMKTIKPIKGLVRKNEKPVVTPTHAPKILLAIVLVTPLLMLSRVIVFCEIHLLY